jgi:hypothetical protein
MKNLSPKHLLEYKQRECTHPLLALFTSKESTLGKSLDSNLAKLVGHHSFHFHSLDPQLLYKSHHKPCIQSRRIIHFYNYVLFFGRESK